MWQKRQLFSGLSERGYIHNHHILLISVLASPVLTTVLLEVIALLISTNKNSCLDEL